jgi:UDP-N-acetylmuramoyl-tripeptide--D-alanyl-D-alanine ligase
MIPPWPDREVREALGLNSDRAQEGVSFTGVSTDSRSVEPGHLFVALKGDRFDGHRFVAEALSRGATGAVVSGPVPGEETTLLYPVSDTLEALGALAGYRRAQLPGRVVGITGSSGKTTTKDLLSEALRGTFRIHASPGNFNNRVGLPLTILSAPKDTEVLVLEMGTNEPGEIGILSEIAHPDLGVITTVSEAHLEKLGSLEGVLEEKLDLLRGLPEGSSALVGDDPPELPAQARAVTPGVRVAGWTDLSDASLRPGEPEANGKGCFHFRWAEEGVHLGIPGRHSVQNALLALGCAEILGVTPADAARRVARVRPGALRSEVRTVGSMILLLDCYNSNPQSARAALDLLSSYPELGPRVAVLGSMLELGERSAALHRKVLGDALGQELDLVVATGKFAEVASELETPAGGPELVIASGLGRAEKVLLERLSGSEVVLLKASRGVAMERLVPVLEARFGTSPGIGGRTGREGENESTGPSSASGGGATRHMAGKEA